MSVGATSVTEIPSVRNAARDAVVSAFRRIFETV
jgi:hypothetical protein